MTDGIIRFCPCCGGQNLDSAVFRSENRARCQDCHTTFTVDSTAGRDAAASAIKDRARTTRRHRRQEPDMPATD